MEWLKARFVKALTVCLLAFVGAWDLGIGLPLLLAGGGMTALLAVLFGLAMLLSVALVVKGVELRGYLIALVVAATELYLNLMWGSWLSAFLDSVIVVLCLISLLETLGLKQA